MVALVLASVLVLGTTLAREMSGGAVSAKDHAKLTRELNVVDATKAVAVKINEASQEAQEAMVSVLREQMNSDWVKALMCYSICPLLPFYLLLSMLNQYMRKILGKILGRHACTKPLTAEDNRSILTLVVSQQMTFLRKSWEWSSILYKAMSLGVILIVVVVGVGKITTIFLSVLNVYLSAFSLSSVCLIYMLVG